MANNDFSFGVAVEIAYGKVKTRRSDVMLNPTSAASNGAANNRKITTKNILFIFFRLDKHPYCQI
jgi:hypothetical protein